MIAPRNTPALFAPYPALLLTAVIADGAPWWCGLLLFAGLAFVALVVGGTLFGGTH